MKPKRVTIQAKMIEQHVHVSNAEVCDKCVAIQMKAVVEQFFLVVLFTNLFTVVLILLCCTVDSY